MGEITVWILANADRFRGRDGQNGRPGQDGKPGDAGKPGELPQDILDRLNQALATLEQGEYQAELLDLDGKVRQTVTFGKNKPLRLRLVPVK